MPAPAAWRKAGDAIHTPADLPERPGRGGAARCGIAQVDTCGECLNRRRGRPGSIRPYSARSGAVPFLKEDSGHGRRGRRLWHSSLFLKLRTRTEVYFGVDGWGVCKRVGFFLDSPVVASLPCGRHHASLHVCRRHCVAACACIYVVRLHLVAGRASAVGRLGRPIGVRCRIGRSGQ
jgi:hypothetical protein